MNQLIVFRQSLFGVELEGCYSYDIQNELFNKIYSNEKFAQVLNNYVNKNKIPVIINKLDNTSLNYFNFIGTDKLDKSHIEQYISKMWCITFDSSIRCSDKAYECEIISPILHMGQNDDKNSIYDKFIHKKNEEWVKLEKNFGDNYYEGIFILIYTILYLLNNQKICIMENALENSTGYHVHYSNKLFTKSITGCKQFAYFLKHYIFFENILFSLADISRTNNEYCKSLYAHCIGIISLIHVLPALIKNLPYETFDKFFDALFEFGIIVRDYRYYSLNTTFIKNIPLNEPIRIEFRLYNGTTNLKEMYAWTMLINLFMSSCILNYNTSNIINFMESKYSVNQYNNENMFNLLFDEFICDKNLKLYYYNLTKRNFAFKDIPEKNAINVIYPELFNENSKYLALNISQIQSIENVEINDNNSIEQDKNLIGGKYLTKYKKYYDKLKKLTNFAL